MTTANALKVQAFHTTDVTEQVRATPGWQQQYRQMSPGYFSGELRCLGLEGVEVYEERLNTRVEQFSARQAARWRFASTAARTACTC